MTRSLGELHLLDADWSMYSVRLENDHSYPQTAGKHLGGVLDVSEGKRGFSQEGKQRSWAKAAER